MGGVQTVVFPTVEDIANLARLYVNDLFTGVGGVAGGGRILTDTWVGFLPLLNTALRTTSRKLRNEGVTFPIIDAFLMENIPAVAQPDPSIICTIGFNGYSNGTTNFPTPRLPGNCLQPLVLRQRVSGSNLQFTPMIEAQDGLPSGYQNQWMGMWEWRNYQLCMNGSVQNQDLMLRYQSGQPAISAPAADFSTTPIFILDCQEAVAGFMAMEFGAARGADQQAMAFRKDATDTAISDMAEEYIRRGQTVNYARVSYQGGGSNNTSDDTGGLGSVGVMG